MSRIAFALLSVVLASCRSNEPQPSAVFSLGDDNDPVVRMALGSGTLDTIQLTVKNATEHAWSAGLITLSPLFTLGGAQSAAMANFVNPGQKAPWGDAAVLAASSGLVLGASASVTPPLAARASFTITVQVPRGATIYYVAATNDDDWGWVGIGPMGTVTAGTASARLGGFYAPDGSGRPVLVNRNVITSSSTAGTTFTMTNLTMDCPAGVMSANATLMKDDFSAGAGQLAWPSIVGYAGDFNGEWTTDGKAARVENPSWPGGDPQAPALPIITGFVKFLDVCPAAGSQLSVAANVVTNEYTDPQSDATLVVYYFDAANRVISVDTSLPLHGGNERRTALYDSAIPEKTRKIAIAPMAYLGATEQGTLYYKQLQVDYAAQPAAATRLYTDTFSAYGPSAFGNNQPSGWSDYGADWYVNPPYKLVTVWNTSWGGGAAPPPYEAGMYKDIALTGKFSAGNTLNARLFASTTFSAAASFTLLRITFSGGQVVDSDRLAGSAWANLDLRGVPIPAGTTSARIDIVAVLGSGETSSLYVQDLSIDVVK